MVTSHTSRLEQESSVRSWQVPGQLDFPSARGLCSSASSVDSDAFYSGHLMPGLDSLARQATLDWGAAVGALPARNTAALGTIAGLVPSWRRVLRHDGAVQRPAPSLRALHSNPAPQADAREAEHFDQPSQSRAVGRER